MYDLTKIISGLMFLQSVSDKDAYDVYNFTSICHNELFFRTWNSLVFWIRPLVIFHLETVRDISTWVHNTYIYTYHTKHHLLICIFIYLYIKT